LLDAGVSISPGEQFGRGFERHARLCFTAVEPARLELGLARLAEVLAAHSP
jgi:aspartate/methionine/tyrosine aminotransferase